MQIKFRGELVNQKAVNVIGNTAAVLAVIMLLAYIDQIMLNVSGRPGSIIQPAALAANCAAWSAYGYFKKERDWKIVLPNTLGVILGAITSITSIYCRAGC